VGYPLPAESSRMGYPSLAKKRQNGVSTLRRREQKLTEHISKVLEDIRADITALEKEVIKKKQLANQLAEMGELPVPYVTIQEPEVARSADIARDDFVGLQLKAAIRSYLRKRAASTPKEKPATVREILDGLTSGGYEFGTKNESSQNRLIRQILSKRTETFRRVGKTYGLTAWYGGPPKQAPKPPSAQKAGSPKDASTKQEDLP